MAKIYLKKSFLGGKNAGFTLIELLVVVLIIGILAAIAVPQYEYAVNKSLFQQAMVVGESIGKAQKVYYMANGKYATDFEDLDIGLPAGFKTSGTSMNNGKISCNTNHSGGRIYCVFVEKRLNNVAYIYWPQTGRRACISFARSNENTHKFCKRFTEKDTYEDYGAWTIYYID